MRPFSFHRAGSVDEAVELLSHHGETAKVICGGQSLLLELKDRSARPGVLVSLRDVPELHGIRHDENGVRLGAATTYRSIGTSDQLDGYAGLGGIARDIADIPVRTMGTVGGSLCQADARFDMPVVLTALDARVHTRGTAGARTRSLEEFFPAPRTPALDAGEVLTEVELPGSAEDLWWGYRKFRMRAMDAAIVSVAVATHKSADGAWGSTRVIVGGCVPTPRRMPEVEAVLDGATGDEETVAEAGRVLSERLEPEVDTLYFEPGYKRTVAGTLLRRAIADLTGPQHK